MGILFRFTGVAEGQNGVTWDISIGRARAVDNQTIQAVTVTWTNHDKMPQTLIGTVKVVDYYMRTLGEVKFPAQIAAGQTQKTILDIPTDQAGSYVKVKLEGKTQSSKEAYSIDDEQIVFTEVLTGPRLRMSLNGTWEMNKGDGKWISCELPYRWDTWKGYHRRQFRKRFILPAQMKGRQIDLHFGGVRFHVKVILNGNVLAEQHTDQMPISVHLTPTARPGEENELILEITDWISCAAPEKQAELRKVWSSAWMQGREIPGMPFIRLATCGLGGAGVSDPIYIIATNKQSVENVFVTPLVRSSKLDIRAELQNKAETPRTLTMRWSVLDGEKTILNVKPVSVTLSPGETKVRETIPFDPEGVRFWWPWNPKLYRLRVDVLDQNTLVDRCDVRFGIREFRADGPVFRINGVPLRPGACAGIPTDFPGLVNYDKKSSLRTWNTCKKYLRSFRDINVNLLRYHTEPYPILMFDQADEIGLMIISEAWMATLPGKMKLDDSRTWKAMREFYPKWVRREFNHPSLVIRSMENELGYHLPAKDQPRSPWGYSNDIVEKIVKNMRLMGKLVKQNDSSRPIMYDGSGPVFYNVADIYNVHYPGIVGGEYLWPITARRMSIPSPSYREKTWLWDRKKPLFVGEYDCYFVSPKHITPLLGDDAYVPAYLNSAHNAYWSFSVPGHRMDGVTAGVPWTPLTFNGNLKVLNPDANWKLKLYKNLFEPIASFIHQYRMCYFGGTKITRTVTTLNDTLTPQKITVQWSLKDKDDKEYLRGQKTMTLGPAESKRTQIPLSLPKVSTPTEFLFSVETQIAGNVKHTDTRTFILYPKTRKIPTLQARYGVVGVPVEPFLSRGMNVKAFDPTGLDLKSIDVLIVAGAGKELHAHAKQIDAFLRRGGRVIALADKKAPAYLPVKIDPVPGGAPLTFADDTNPGKTFTVPAPGSSVTILHPRIPGHPVLQGLGQRQLRYWRESHIAADYTLKKPMEYSAWSLLDCGRGFVHTALLEIPHDRGAIVTTTLPVLDLIENQPAASILLDNLLSYADRYQPSQVPQAVGVLESTKRHIESTLRTLGGKSYSLRGRLAELKSLSPYAALIVQADVASLEELTANRDKIRQFVRNGGVVWLQSPTPETEKNISELIGRPITIQPHTLTKPIQVQNRGLLSGVTNDDLFWPEGSFLPTASKRTAKYTVQAKGEGITALTHPPAVVSVAEGKGYWLLDEIAWPGEFSQRQRALQYVRAILPNLGLQVRKSRKMESRSFDETLGYESVDITTWCNEGFVGGIWNGPKMGLLGLPTGRQILGGNLYQIVNPQTNGGKGCVGFRSEKQNKGGVATVTIPVERKAASLHLLLTSLWTNTLSAETRLLDIVVEYDDGTKKNTGIRYGRDVLDWCTNPPGAARTHPRVVWVGRKWPQPGLFDFTWINPEPGKTIRSITLRAVNNTGFAALLAVTTQRKLSATQTKTSNWIPGLEK